MTDIAQPLEPTPTLKPEVQDIDADVAAGAVEDPQEPAEAGERVSGRSWLKFLFQMTLLVVVVLTTRASVADHYYVPSGSMEPTIQVGDRLFVNKLSYGIRVPTTRVWLYQDEPDRGDVIVFHAPHDDTVMVKRLIGLPGDTLRFNGTNLYINSNKVDHLKEDGALWEDLLGVKHPLYKSRDQGPAFIEMRVPDDAFFAMGDHRGNSADSRSWGFIPRENLLGRATRVIYSQKRKKTDFTDRFWLPLSEPDARLVR